ncbi:MAG: hypothetical protein HKN43_02630 [Rhodothermales bacterium]|nr:hypothetical protein [Rhodothermales bacterium]
MGIFSKLKNLTGGWADVSVITEDARRGDSTEVMIQVSVKDEPIEISRIYITLRCVEEVRVPNYRVNNAGTSGGSTSVNVNATEVLHEQEYTATGATRLDAGILEAVPCTLDLPGHMPPSFEGRNARVRWLVKAGLDMSGNDPDSGWQELPVA